MTTSSSSSSSSISLHQFPLFPPLPSPPPSSSSQRKTPHRHFYSETRPTTTPTTTPTFRDATVVIEDEEEEEEEEGDDSDEDLKEGFRSRGKLEYRVLGLKGNGYRREDRYDAGFDEEEDEGEEGRGDGDSYITEQRLQHLSYFKGIAPHSSSGEMGLEVGGGGKGLESGLGAVGWDLVNRQLEKSGLVKQRLPFPNSYCPSHLEDSVLLQKTILKLLLHVERASKERSLLHSQLETLRTQLQQQQQLQIQQHQQLLLQFKRKEEEKRVAMLQEQTRRHRQHEEEVRSLRQENQDLKLELRRLVLEQDRQKLNTVVQHQQQTSSNDRSSATLRSLAQLLSLSNTDQLFPRVQKLAKTSCELRRIVRTIATGKAIEMEQRIEGGEEGEGGDELELLNRVDKFVRHGVTAIKTCNQLKSIVFGREVITRLSTANNSPTPTPRTPTPTSSPSLVASSPSLSFSSSLVERLVSARAILEGLNDATTHPPFLAKGSIPSSPSAGTAMTTSGRRLQHQQSQQSQWPVVVLEQLKMCLEQLFDVRSIDGLLPKIHALSCYVSRTWTDLRKVYTLFSIHSSTLRLSEGERTDETTT